MGRACAKRARKGVGGCEGTRTRARKMKDMKKTNAFKLKRMNT